MFESLRKMQLVSIWISDPFHCIRYYSFLTGIVPLGDVVKLFDKDILKQLKSECGGLQTLLKNHNSIFHGNVISNVIQ